MLSVLSISEAEKWDSIVRSFINYDVYYLSGYAKAFQTHGNGEPLLIYYDYGNIRAINVVMKRDIAQDWHFVGKLPENTYFDLATPYGYGGFLLEGSNTERLNREYEEWCRDNDVISEFVRFHLFSGYEKHYLGDVVTKMRNVVRYLDMKLDDLLMDFEHKVRKNIKRAIKNNLGVVVDENAQQLDEFLNIYYGTMDRNGAEDTFYFERPFFEIMCSMKGNSMLFHVMYEENIISTELVLYGKEYCYSFIGGTNSDYYDLRPNDYLKLEIIKWAYGKGLKAFVLGGGYGVDDGIFKYKKSFAPHGIVDFYIGKRIFNQSRYEELLQIRKQDSMFDETTEYFPLYRA